MAVPSTAFKFAAAMDSSEVLDWIIPFTPVLEPEETIDGAPGRWSLELLPAAMAVGFEIIEGDEEYPDPHLVSGGTAVRFWTRVDPAFIGDPVFEGGFAAPMVGTIWTDAVPPRRRQRTAVLTIVEQ